MTPHSAACGSAWSTSCLVRRRAPARQSRYRFRSLFRACFCLSAGLFVQPLFAQQPETATLSVTTRLVAVDAVVRDRKGLLAPHLTRDDFTLLVDGQPQPIRYFAEESGLPLTLGLLVDTSGSERRYFPEQQAASRTFLTRMLTGPADAALIARFDTRLLVLQSLTHDLPLLESGLGQLDKQLPPADGPSAGTHLFDALCAASAQAFGASPITDGRRALVVLTDGEDTGSLHTRDEAIECAQRARITLYIPFYSSREAITDDRFDPRVPVYPHEHLPGRTNVERLARSTGGRVFLVGHAAAETGHATMDTIYTDIQRELRHQYRMAFTPPPGPSGSYHSLILKPRDKHLAIQTRLGYYAP